MTVEARIKKLEAVAAPEKFEPWGSVNIHRGDDVQAAIREKYGDNRPTNMIIGRIVSPRHQHREDDPRCCCLSCWERWDAQS